MTSRSEFKGEIGPGDVARVGFCVMRGERVRLTVSSDVALSVVVAGARFASKFGGKLFEWSGSSYDGFLDLEPGCYVVEIKASGKGYADVVVSVS